MALAKSLRNYILADSVISWLTTQVWRKRVEYSKTNPPPYIVVSVTPYENKIWRVQSDHWYRGRNVTIDVVWPLEMDDTLEIINDRLIAILGKFQWDMNGRVWSLSFKMVDDGYDEKTDYTIYRVGFLAKEIY